MVQHSLAGIGLVKGMDMSFLTKFSNILNQQNKEAVDQGLDSIHGDQVAHQADRARDYRGQARTAQFENVQLGINLGNATSELEITKKALLKSKCETVRMQGFVESYAAAMCVMKDVIEDLRRDESELRGLDEKAFAQMLNDAVEQMRMSAEGKKVGRDRVFHFVEGCEFTNPDGGFIFEYPHFI